MAEIAAISSADTNMTLASDAAAPVNRGIILHDVDRSSNDDNTISFDNFLDMINPLEHIPIVSSIYRAVTGETINPVARIAGDALYGGVFGLASAGISALGALGDEAFAAINGGKSASTTFVAALFGDDDDKTVQVAANNTPAPTETVATPEAPTGNLGAIGQVPSAPPNLRLAALQTPAMQSPILDMPDMTAAAVTPTAAPAVLAAPTPTPLPTILAPTVTPSISPDVLAQTVSNAYAAAANTKGSDAQNKLRDAAAAATSTGDPSLGLALNNGKLPYGGAMDTSLLQKAMENQTVALAMANNRNNMQSAHTIRNSRLAVSNEVTSAAAAIAAGGVPAGVGGASASTALPGASSAALLATPSALTATPLTAASPVASSDMIPTPPAANAATTDTATSSTAVLPALADDAHSFHSLSKYRNAAQGMPLPGASTVNVTN